MFAITTLIFVNCLCGPALSDIVETQQLNHGHSIRQAPNTSDTQTHPIEMSIAYDFPDITSEIQLQSGSVQLEGFKSVNNDKIMEGTKTSELFWVSIGHPHFIKTRDPNIPDDAKFFHSSNTGFTTYVQMMTEEQRAALATAAHNKYQINIADHQVVHLILSKFYCNKFLYDETGNRYLLSGIVSDFRHFPLRMDFDIPLGKIERILFSKVINEYEDDLQFECHIESSGGKLIKSNTLSISYEQSQQIGLEEKLFGPAGSNGKSEIYVTRNQMTELAHEMYSTLNIIEEYQMPESQFSEAFVNDFISQVATSQFSQVPLETALASISKYRFYIDADLRPYTIKNDIDLVLSISKEATTNNKVVPKSLNVARVLRSKMKKSLTFKGIRFQKFDAPFERDFSMYTSRSSELWNPNISTAKERYEEMLESISHNVLYLMNASRDLMIQATDIANIQKDLLSQSKKLDSIQKRLPGKDSKTEAEKIVSRHIKEQLSRKVVTATVPTEDNLALKRPTAQSSTMWDYAASRAVDGNKQANFGQSSCSHTNDDPGEPNWWRVKLDRPYRVRKVTVTNRGDCCANRLDYFIVGVTNSTEDPVIGAYPLCGQYPSTVASGATVTLDCDPDISAGQYVIIQQPNNGTGWLTLCEVAVYGETENLALRRPATQSSVLSSDLYGVCDASRAVDGNKQANFESLSCSHTDDGPGGPNWWRVRLDRPYRVREVTVTNRGDCCASRLDYFIVGVTNSTEDPVIGDYPLCGQYPSTVASGATVTLDCDPDISAGQYVILQQPSNGTGSFTLCEVEVYGETAIVSSEVNLALSRPTTQSSTFLNHEASKAVDGNTTTVLESGSCSHTDDGPGGPNWWRVKLDRPYHVQKVTVTNRGDCCGNRLDYFIVGVTNSTEDPVRGAYPLCGQYPSRALCSEAMTVYCDPDISAGQYVIIQQPNNGVGSLTLCEVEVYEEPVID